MFQQSWQVLFAARVGVCVCYLLLQYSLINLTVIIRCTIKWTISLKDSLLLDELSQVMVKWKVCRPCQLWSGICDVTNGWYCKLVALVSFCWQNGHGHHSCWSRTGIKRKASWGIVSSGCCGSFIKPAINLNLNYIVK